MARTTLRRVAVRERRNREHEVLDAAVEVFWRKGYAAASVQEVADAVGVLKGSLYHYISSKEELLARIFEENDRDSMAIMEAVNALDVGPLERLHAFVSRFMKYYAENIKRVDLYFREWRFIGGDVGAEVRERRKLYDGFVRKLLQEAIDAGQLPDTTDVRVTTYYVMAALNGLPNWYRPGGRLSAAQVADRYADLTLAAVGAVSSR
jgi:TetR/AcrR family transcriptional regulator, cholesterol catabolism regulator